MQRCLEEYWSHKIWSVRDTDDDDDDNGDNSEDRLWLASMSVRWQPRSCAGGKATVEKERACGKRSMRLWAVAKAARDETEAK